MKRCFKLSPIGIIRHQDSSMFIEIFERYRDGLLGLDNYSHAHVIGWFHENDTEERRGTLLVHPRGDRSNPLTGVFATRSPVRPNLIALFCVRIRSIEGLKIHIEQIDALDGTPVVDIKPYLSRKDCIPDATGPDWAKKQ
ncbi:MAG: tRNA (N6-threonylcarbamoyladenosine(37)-N6)-methyltransferase TrmO [Deltaproteobacteria bacterium]|nr:tRNA (N6-threonylcarbamoyladenosine(37)-N6)-methyltransferase TrmO [Deltaproteobacteria bacterium]